MATSMKGASLTRSEAKGAMVWMLGERKKAPEAPEEGGSSLHFHPTHPSTPRQPSIPLIQFRIASKNLARPSNPFQKPCKAKAISVIHTYAYTQAMPTEDTNQVFAQADAFL